MSKKNYYENWKCSAPHGRLEITLNYSADKELTEKELEKDLKIALLCQLCGFGILYLEKSQNELPDADGKWTIL